MADIVYSVKKLSYIIDSLIMDRKQSYEQAKLKGKQKTVNIKHLRDAYGCYLTATEEQLRKGGYLE
jgi:hypothetical protein